jgi:protoporphyrinogen oxidase
MPITEFVRSVTPRVKKKIAQSAKELRYRDHITVNLIISGNTFFKDQWIYVHDTGVLMARIANYNNFYPRGEQKKDTAISVEYFTFRENSLWKSSDTDLVSLASQELVKLGLATRDHILNGFVVREINSYPMYFSGYQSSFDQLKKYCESISNVALIGRGGMYKYNNMDHSMEDGLQAAQRFLHPELSSHLNRNNEDEYVE